MSNTFGRRFKVTTFGESHGPMMGCVVDGCPSNFPLSVSDIQPFLDERKPGTSPYTSQRREPDQVEIVSGVFEGKTTGAPITLLIPNQNARTKDYDAIKDILRPGHADFTYQKKYGHRDHRGGGRASARETVARVAAGAIASLYLKQTHGLQILGYLAQMGDLALTFESFDEVYQNPFFCPNGHQVALLEQEIHALRKAGDSIGAQVNVMATGVPIGLGEPIFGKLNAELAHAMVSIPGVKGVSFGSGFDVVRQKGSAHRDEMDTDGFLSHRSGGTLGGISTGQDLTVQLAFKPTSSIRIPGQTLNQQGEITEVVTKGRHDPCIGIRGVPIAKAMMALVLMDAMLLAYSID